ncbi:hypothetical protein EJ08DRAFT_329464 [Tothia fuscella]|uniref:Protein transport protein sec16 n=1 Tax=Tothia fuscella TaxID=1048955 RepID=A0A9P4TX31_9PEZI|nr:hypothetical protein EJ08DRAFT_329464 [Tothia fuscella]
MGEPAQHDHPEDTYDYQGEATTLDEAVQEDPEASLVANAATPGGFEGGWSQGDDAWDLDTATQTPLDAAQKFGANDAGYMAIGDVESPQESQKQVAANVLDYQQQVLHLEQENKQSMDNAKAKEYAVPPEADAETSTTPDLKSALSPSKLVAPTGPSRASQASPGPEPESDGSHADDTKFNYGSDLGAEPQSGNLGMIAPAKSTPQAEGEEQSAPAADLNWDNSEDVDFGFGTEATPESQDLDIGAPVESGSHTEATENSAPSADVDWGTSEDIDLGFGTVSDKVDDFSKDITTAPTTTTNGGDAGETDLSAIWSAELGDDDLLLDENAAAAFAFEDDGEGFLDDFPGQENAGLGLLDTNLSQSGGRGHMRQASVKYTPADALAPAPVTPSNPYLPQAPQFTDLSPKTQQSKVDRRVSMASPYQAPYQPPQVTRPGLPTGESFADKAKGGYSSPYDLPEDLNVSRRRPAHHKIQSPQIQQTSQPPPRLSSMQSSPALNQSQQKPTPPLSSFAARNNFTPPSSSHSVQAPHADGAFGGPLGGSTSPEAAARRQPLNRSTSEMFAELPVVQRPQRGATPSGRFTPQLPGQATGMAPTIGRGNSYSVPPQASAQTVPPQHPAAQLQAPARIAPYAEDTSQLNRISSIPAQPPVSTRYSPAIPPAAGVQRAPSFPVPLPVAAPSSAPPPGPSRYSPAPSSTHPSVPNAQPRYTSQPPPAAPPRAISQQYAPRTSSPLAYHAPSQEQAHHISSTSNPDVTSHPSDGALHGRPNYDRNASLASQQPLLETLAEDEPYGTVKPLPQALSSAGRTATPPPASARSGPPSSVSSPRKRANYAPQQPLAAAVADPAIIPPRRSQTSSPGAALKNPRLAMTNFDSPRPASAHGPISPKLAVAQLSRAQTMPRQPACEESNLLMPQDDRAQDPLQRWKGAPIFNFGIGSSVVSSFPKYVPRYGAGQIGPMIKPTQDVVRTTTINEIVPPADLLAKFPGPLKKGKKKEVLAWLKATTENMQHANQHLLLNGMVPPPVHKQREEKLLLWKVMSLTIENDGALDGNPAVEEQVRLLISPTLTGDVTTADAFGATQAPSLSTQPEAHNSAALNTLRNQLYAGKREEAVWHAADQRLWAHALLIASTLQNRDLWKQVVQEFVRKEIRKIGENTEALAALYQVFAGNFEESIDELVSVSARAGFEMVSTANTAGTQKDALAGLDRWRETLLLILNNRSNGDAQALVALGKLLSGYGRVEAAHVCFLFAKNTAIFAGADDPQAHFSLVGGSPSTQGADFGNDLDTILLSEVYEFSATLASATAVPSVPHLQAYKLYHAEVLAEMGKRTEAQGYCDAIAAIITSKSHRSPYYNKQLMGWVDELNSRLSQAPVDGAGSANSWKPSMDRVSTSLWGKFNNFIAGEDNESKDGNAKGAAPPASEIGNFARLTGETPPMTRAVSSADLYGGYNANGSTGAPASGNSRYAPHKNNVHAPRTSMESVQNAYGPSTLTRTNTGTSSLYEPRSSMEQQQRARLQPAPPIFSPGHSEGYQATPLAVPSPSYQSSTMEHEQGQAENMDGYQQSPPPTSSFDEPQQHSPYAQPLQSQPSPYDPQSSSFDASQPQPDSSPYDGTPRSQSSYQPYEPSSSSYQPYEPEQRNWDADEPDSPNEEKKKPKKKSFMDDDDDDEILRRAAELKGKGAADEAFKKAAEADARKDSRPPNHGQKGSWFGGFSLFGKKDPNAPQSGPIKAKLGEESSFVFDKDLGKWVNKKAGASNGAPTSSGTPPPPKSSAPPSRAASSMGPIPSARAESPAMSPTPPPIGGAGLPPHPNPSTSLSSTAPSLGLSAPTMPPMARSASSPMPPPGSSGGLAGLGGGLASRPPSRPTTSMSGASDLDDLMGPPLQGGRRPGGKKAPRKGRYVDVMANTK